MMKETISSGEVVKVFGIMTETRSIYSIIKAKLLIIILMVISALFILNSAGAQELDFSFPGDITQNQDFKVLINFETEETYDVKIFAHNSEDGKVSRGEYISEIFNPVSDKWQDSWNYLSSLFPEEKEYSLKISESNAKEICVRLRKSGTDSTILKCAYISVNAESLDQNEDNEDEQQEDDEENQISDEEDEEQEEEAEEENKESSTNI